MCMLPALIWGSISVLLVFSQLVYTAGVTFPVIMLLVLMNRKTARWTLPHGKGQWNSPYQALSVALPFCADSHLSHIVHLDGAFHSLSGLYLLGVPGIVLHPFGASCSTGKYFRNGIRSWKTFAKQGDFLSVTNQ